MNVRDFAIDPATGDLAVVNGDFQVVADFLACLQAIGIAVQLFLGEYWLDESIGVDWLGSVLVPDPDPNVVRGLIAEAVAGVPDVTEVVGASLIRNGDRTASISYTVRTIYSQQPTEPQTVDVILP